LSVGSTVGWLICRGLICRGSTVGAQMSMAQLSVYQHRESILNVRDSRHVRSLLTMLCLVIRVLVSSRLSLLHISVVTAVQLGPLVCTKYVVHFLLTFNLKNLAPLFLF
jgi:hypothetical protein